MVSPMIKKFVEDYGFKHSEVPDLTGKVAVVTGGSNGIGLSYARTLYTHGAHLHILTQPDQQIGPAAEAYIKTGDLEKAPKDYQAGFGSHTDESGQGGSKDGSITLYDCDLADLKAVASVADNITSKIDRLDLVATIAGIGVNAFARTKDGYDSHLTINCLSHHLLISKLFPLLKKTSEQPGSDVRILNMASESHRHDLAGPSEAFGGDRFRTTEEFKREVGPASLYGRTKIGNILFTKALLQKHLQSTSILTFSTHPGVVATGQQGQFKDAYGEVAGAVLGAVVRPLARTPDQGAVSILWASTAPDARNTSDYPNGSYFSDPKVLGGESGEGQDQELVDNFYEQSEKILKEVVGKPVTW